VHFGAVDTIFLATGVLIVGAGIYAALALPPEPPPSTTDQNDLNGTA
jgi:hypothetical protein